LEVEALQNNESIKIIALEKTFERLLEHSGLPFPILIKGNVDRIEIRNGKIRIIDYKTGKVEKKNVVLSTWDGLTNDIKNDKIIQVLAYAYMFENEAQGLPIEAGILSFKNLKEGFLPFSFKVGKEVVATIDQTILNDYVEQIVLLLKEIYTASVPFEEKVN
jgi:CRISPR/Cas system-associated exonuclease Cas4 (RecB family)